MRGLPNILSLFRNEFNTGARMLDSIYHIIKKSFFGREIVSVLL